MSGWRDVAEPVPAEGEFARSDTWRDVAEPAPAEPPISVSPKESSWREVGQKIRENAGPAAEQGILAAAEGMIDLGDPVKFYAKKVNNASEMDKLRSEKTSGWADKASNYLDQADLYGAGVMEDVTHPMAHLATAGLSAIYPEAATDIDIAQKAAGKQAEENAPHTGGPLSLKNIAYTGGVSLLQNAPTMLAAVLTRNPELALGPMATQQAGQEYADQRAAGRDPYQAALPALAYGKAERIGEGLPLGEMMKEGVGNIWKRIGKTTLAGVIGETATQAMQDGIDKGTIKPDMTLGDFMSDLALAGITGGVTDAAISIPAHGIHALRGANTAEDPPANEGTLPGTPPAPMRSLDDLLAEEAPVAPAASSSNPPSAPSSPAVPSRAEIDGILSGDISLEDVQKTMALEQPQNLETASPEGFVHQVTGAVRPVGQEASAPTLAQQVDLAGAEAASSPFNDRPEPTPAQKDAGNYAKGHMKLHGLDISIETPKGGERSGVTEDGQTWSNIHQHAYGYIRGTEGADGEHVDVHIGPHPESQRVYVIDQSDPKTGNFDEHKVILGARTPAEAQAIYDSGFSDGTGPSRVMGMKPMSMGELKEWLKVPRKNPASGAVNPPSPEKVADWEQKYSTKNFKVLERAAKALRVQEGTDPHEMAVLQRWLAKRASQPIHEQPQNQRKGPPRPRSIFTVIRDMGGLADEPTTKGELIARDMDKSIFSGGLLAAQGKGVTLSHLQEYLEEDGWFPGKNIPGHPSDVGEDDVWNLIDRHISSKTGYHPNAVHPVPKVDKDAERHYIENQAEYLGIAVEGRSSDEVMADIVASTLAKDAEDRGDAFEDDVVSMADDVASEYGIPFEIGETHGQVESKPEPAKEAAGTAQQPETAPAGQAAGREPDGAAGRGGEAAPQGAAEVESPFTGDVRFKVNTMSRHDLQQLAFHMGIKLTPRLRVNHAALIDAVEGYPASDILAAAKDAEAARPEGAPQDKLQAKKPRGGYIIRNKDTKETIREFFPQTAEKLSNVEYSLRPEFEVVPAGQHLAELNNKPTSLPSETSTNPVKKEEVATEQTSQGTQTIIPGAEKIKDKELAARGMEGRKQPKAAQKTADSDGGLFDTEARKEQDLFAGAPKAVSSKSQVFDAYHGTSSAFDTPDVDAPYKKDSGWLGKGHYAYTSPQAASLHAGNMKGKGNAHPNVRPVKVRLENPYTVSMAEKEKIRFGGESATQEFTDRLKAAGHDGAVMELPDGTKEIVAFDTAAVKTRMGKGDNEKVYSLGQTKTPAFKKWFGDSKVVDEKGEPLVVYHGTTNADKIQESGFKKGWIHLADSKVVADSYQEWVKGSRPDTLPVYAKIENPVYYDAKGQKYTEIGNKIFRASWDAEKAGNDGMIIQNVRDNQDSSVDVEPHTTYVAFSPTQIKSATGNRGTFDPEDVRIQYSVKPTSNFQKDAKRLKKEVLALAKRMNPNADVSFVDQLFGEGEATKASGGTGERQEAAGSYDRLHDLIEVSMNLNKFNPKEAAYHELWHSLEGFLTEGERKLLVEKFPGKDGMSHAEETAYAFQQWAMENRETFPRVTRIFAKVRNFLREVARIFKDSGYRSVDEIFERAESGQFKDRRWREPITEEQVRELQTVAAPMVKETHEIIQKIRKEKDLPVALKDAVRGLLRSNDHVIHTIQRARNSKAVGEIRKALFPGAFEDLNAGATYSEAVSDNQNRIIAQITRPLEGLSQRKQMLVSRALQEPKEKGFPEDVLRAAVKMKKGLDEHRKYLVDNGIEINEIVGYFRRVYDQEAILKAEDRFKRKAKEAQLLSFRKDFEEEIRSGMKAKGEVVNEKAFIEAEVEKMAEAKAERWFDNVMLDAQGLSPFETDIRDMLNPTPSPSSPLKSRVLVKEVDDIMREFLVQDPIEALVPMVMSTVRRIEFEKRFGKEKWAEAEKAMKADGVTGKEINTIKAAVLSATGMLPHGNNDNTAAWVRLLTYYTFMGRSVLSSLPEFALTSVRTKNPMDALRALKYTLAYTRKGEKTREAMEIMESMGMVSQYVEDIILMSRMDTGLKESKLANQLSAKYFRRVGLTQWTNATRVASVRVGMRYLPELAKDTLGGKLQNLAKRELRELGVPKGREEEFARWVKKNGITPESMKWDRSVGGLDDMTKYARLALARFSRTGGVLQGSGIDRPYLAQKAWGNIFLALQGYNNAFTKHVLMRAINQTEEGYKVIFKNLAGKESEYSLREGFEMLPSMFAWSIFFAVVVAVREMRDELLAKKPGLKQEEWQRWMRYASAAGITGSIDPYINAFTQARYQRDPATVFAGPEIGNLFDFAGALGSYVVDDDKGTSKERNLAKAAYNLVLQPAGVALSMELPGFISAPLIQAVGHPATKEAFVTAAGGEKKKR